MRELAPMLQVTAGLCAPVTKRRAGEGLADTFGLREGAFPIAAREHDEEFLAAVAAHGIIGADGVLMRRADSRRTASPAAWP